MIAVDANILLLFLSPIAAPPLDKTTNAPVTFARERVQRLVEDVHRQKTKVIVPTPALSECLVHAGAARNRYIQVLQKYSVFRIAPFDSKAAIELAIMTEKALKAGDKKGGVDAPWAKVKFDRQIIAIAKVEGAHTIYTDDPGVRTFAEANGMQALGLSACPLPERKEGQGSLFERQGTKQSEDPERPA